MWDKRNWEGRKDKCARSLLLIVWSLKRLSLLEMQNLRPYPRYQAGICILMRPAGDSCEQSLRASGLETALELGAAKAPRVYKTQRIFTGLSKASVQGLPVDGITHSVLVKIETNSGSNGNLRGIFIV